MKRWSHKKKRSEGCRPKLNRPTMQMLLKELSVTKNQTKRKLILEKIESVREYCKSQQCETVTYYPDRKKTNLNEK